MTGYHVEMLAASRRLISREDRPKGRLPSARVRRSISTTYYALFHFLLDECANQLIGTENYLRKRRRTFVRVLIHKGMKSALDKVRGVRPDEAMADYLAGPNRPLAETPPFVRDMAGAFRQAQDKRHEADYDLNTPLIALDAVLLIERVEEAILAWRHAKMPADRDLKKALCLLMALGGRLREGGA